MFDEPIDDIVSDDTIMAWNKNHETLELKKPPNRIVKKLNLLGSKIKVNKEQAKQLKLRDMANLNWKTEIVDIVSDDTIMPWNENYET